MTKRGSLESRKQRMRANEIAGDNVPRFAAARRYLQTRFATPVRDRRNLRSSVGWLGTAIRSQDRPSSEPLLKRIILFRFHNSLDICTNRLELLHRFNPGASIIGLWGGDRSGLLEARQALASRLEYIWEIPMKSPLWKWQHADLSLLMWYRHEGRHIPFDMLHLVEWDLLLLASLDRIYGETGRGGVALTGLTPLERIRRNWYWTSVEPYATQWRQLQEHVRDHYGWQGPHSACQGPASAFSKAFLERCSLEEIPELVNEELRIPLYARALGFKVVGLPHIYGDIKNPREMKFFNCEKVPIKERTIRWELLKPWGRRVFHPYRKIW